MPYSFFRRLPRSVRVGGQGRSTPRNSQWGYLWLPVGRKRATLVEPSTESGVTIGVTFTLVSSDRHSTCMAPSHLSPPPLSLIVFLSCMMRYVVSLYNRLWSTCCCTNSLSYPNPAGRRSTDTINQARYGRPGASTAGQGTYRGRRSRRCPCTYSGGWTDQRSGDSHESALPRHSGYRRGA